MQRLAKISNGVNCSEFQSRSGGIGPSSSWIVSILSYHHIYQI